MSLQQYRPPKSVKILYWNPDLKGNDKARFHDKLYLTKCSSLPCRFVINRADEADADAIVFSWYERGRFLRMPNRSTYEQMWIFMTLERPMVLPIPNTKYDEYRPVFNWTMTYSNDADIQKPYRTFHYRYTRKRRRRGDAIHHQVYKEEDTPWDMVRLE